MYHWLCKKELGSDPPKLIFHRGGGFHPPPWEPRKKYAMGNRVKLAHILLETTFDHVILIIALFFKEQNLKNNHPLRGDHEPPILSFCESNPNEPNPSVRKRGKKRQKMLIIVLSAIPKTAHTLCSSRTKYIVERQIEWFTHISFRFSLYACFWIKYS